MTKLKALPLSLLATLPLLLQACALDDASGGVGAEGADSFTGDEGAASTTDDGDWGDSDSGEGGDGDSATGGDGESTGDGGDGGGGEAQQEAVHGQLMPNAPRVRKSILILEVAALAVPA